MAEEKRKAKPSKRAWAEQRKILERVSKESQRRSARQQRERQRAECEEEEEREND